MSLSEWIMATLALWVATNAGAEFLGSWRDEKPLNCQKCLSGWPMLAIGIGRLFGGPDVESALEPLSWWAGSVLLEAIYQRLRTFVV